MIWDKNLHHEAYRTMLLGVVAVFVVQFSFFFVDLYTIGNTIALIDAAHFSASLAVIVWLLKNRKNYPSVDAMDLVFFLVLFLPFLVSIWIGELAAAELGQIREPMIPYQLLMVFLALFSPGRNWLSALEIFITLVMAVVFWLYMSARFALPAVYVEPWLTLIFGFVSLMLLSGRAYRRKMIVSLAKTRAEAEAFERASRLFLAVRDRTNTPLQNLELCSALLERGKGEAIDLSRKIRISLNRLKELSEIMAETENWHASFKEGKDISSEIQKTFARLEKSDDSSTNL